MNCSLQSAVCESSFRIVAGSCQVAWRYCTGPNTGTAYFLGTGLSRTRCHPPMATKLVRRKRKVITTLVGSATYRTSATRSTGGLLTTPLYHRSCHVSLFLQICLAIAALSAHAPSSEWGDGVGLVQWLGKHLGSHQNAVTALLELLAVIPQVTLRPASLHSVVSPLNASTHAYMHGKAMAARNTRTPVHTPTSATVAPGGRCGRRPE